MKTTITGELTIDIYSEDGKKIIGQKRLEPVVGPFGKQDMEYIRKRSALVPNACEIAKSQMEKLTHGKTLKPHEEGRLWNSIFSSVMEELARPLYA